MKCDDSQPSQETHSFRLNADRTQQLVERVRWHIDFETRDHPAEGQRGAEQT